MQRNRIEQALQEAFRKDFKTEWKVHTATVPQQITSAQETKLPFFCLDTTNLDAEQVHAQVEYWMNAQLREKFGVETADLANDLLWGRTERPA